MQVRNLLQLYVDVEHTGRDAQFIEKFEQRERMGELLSAPPVRPPDPSASTLHACLGGCVHSPAGECGSPRAWLRRSGDGALRAQPTSGIFRRTGRRGGRWRPRRAAPTSCTTASATTWTPTASTSSTRCSASCPRVRAPADAAAAMRILVTPCMHGVLAARQPPRPGPGSMSGAWRCRDWPRRAKAARSPAHGGAA